MKKRYVVAIDTGTKEQNDAFVKLLRERGLGWWHWLTNCWLITDSRGQLSASELRDKVQSTFQCNCLVLELRDGDDTWAGYGPQTEKRDMFKWLKENW